MNRLAAILIVFLFLFVVVFHGSSTAYDEKEKKEICEKYRNLLVEVEKVQEEFKNLYDEQCKEDANTENCKDISKSIKETEKLVATCLNFLKRFQCAK